MTSITVDFYSEKAIVVRNTLEHHGSVLSAINGTFNERLKGGRGWIFPKHMLTQVRNIVEKLNSGQYGNEYEQKSQSTSKEEYVLKSEFLSVLSRLERLEAMLPNHMLTKPSQKPTPTPKPVPEEVEIELEIDLEDEPERDFKPLTILKKTTMAEKTPMSEKTVKRLVQIKK